MSILIAAALVAGAIWWSGQQIAGELRETRERYRIGPSQVITQHCFACARIALG